MHQRNVADHLANAIGQTLGIACLIELDRQPLVVPHLAKIGMSAQMIGTPYSHAMCATPLEPVAEEYGITMTEAVRTDRDLLFRDVPVKPDGL